MSGQAQVRFFGESSINGVAVNYANYSDGDAVVLNGYEDVTVSVKPLKMWENNLEWYSDVVQTKFGIVTGTKSTSVNGFHLRIDAMTNIFDVNGTMKRIVDNKEYEQFVNGT